MTTDYFCPHCGNPEAIPPSEPSCPACRKALLAHLRKQDYATAASLLDGREDAITQVITLHTAAATNDVARAEFALNSLQNECPENILSLRDELATQFKLKKGTPCRDADWIFDQEYNALALNATFQIAA